MNIIQRKSARAIVLTPANEILLIKIDNPEGGWSGWITPGGGVDEGESKEFALKRELEEELGLMNIQIGAKIWTRFHSFPWQGNTVEQHEEFYLVHSNRFKALPNPEVEDIDNLKNFHWWTLEELANSKDNFAPEQIYNHLKELMEKGTPQNPIKVGV